MRISLIVLAASLLLGCVAEEKSKTSTPLCPSGFGIESGDSLLCVDRETAAIELFGPDGDRKLSTGDGWLGFGRDPQYDSSNSYDPNYFADNGYPDGWIVDRVDQISSYAETPSGGYKFEVTLRSGLSAQLLIAPSVTVDPPEPLPPSAGSAPVEDSFDLSLIPPANSNAANVFVVIPSQGDDENFYGLGEYFDQPAQAGKARAMHIVVDMNIESGYNEAHAPIPFFTSNLGWGFFARSDYPGRFDMGATGSSTLIEFAADRLDFHLMAARKPIDILPIYAELSALPLLPPKWAFAPMMWRNWVTGGEQVLEDARVMRDIDLAAGVMWIDRPYQSYYESYTFADNFTQPVEMIEQLHREGFRVMVWAAPYLSATGQPSVSSEAIDKYQHYLDKEWFVDLPAELPRFGCSDCRMIDLTNSAAAAAWTDQIKRITDIGIEGFKLDYGEDIQIGLFGTTLPTAFSNGQTELTMHHRFSSYYAKTYREAVDGEGFVIARTGAWGGASVSNCIWPGDLDTGFEKHREKIERGSDSYIAVGGLPAAVAAGISLAASGWPYFASDTGGYRHGRPTSDVLVRWASYSALMPIMQFGGGSNHLPWDFADHDGDGKRDYNQTTLSHFKKYARLHLRLFPFFYTFAVETAATGMPAVRPLGLAYPDDNLHPPDQFLLGDHLLVAPVVEDAPRRTVYFPKAEWINFFTGEMVSGPDELKVEAPVGDLPLYQKAGTIIPMLRPEIDTLSPASVTNADSFADDPGELWLRIAPASGEQALFNLYDGTSVRASVKGGAITVELLAGDDFSRGWRLQVYGGARSVKIGGADAEAVASVADLADCSSCWTASDEGVWVEISAPAAATIISINR